MLENMFVMEFGSDTKAFGSEVKHVVREARLATREWETMFSPERPMASKGVIRYAAQAAVLEHERAAVELAIDHYEIHKHLYLEMAHLENAEFDKRACQRS